MCDRFKQLPKRCSRFQTLIKPCPLLFCHPKKYGQISIPKAHLWGYLSLSPKFSVIYQNMQNKVWSCLILPDLWTIPTSYSSLNISCNPAKLNYCHFLNCTRSFPPDSWILPFSPLIMPFPLLPQIRILPNLLIPTERPASLWHCLWWFT